jgi:hypothetical protein
MSVSIAPQQDESWKQDPWLGVNPFDPAFKDDPYPFLKRLRDYDPVNETPIGVYRLTRYDDVIRILPADPLRRCPTHTEGSSLRRSTYGGRLGIRRHQSRGRTVRVHLAAGSPRSYAAAQEAGCASCNGYKHHGRADMHDARR